MQTDEGILEERSQNGTVHVLRLAQYDISIGIGDSIFKVNKTEGNGWIRMARSVIAN